jgi:hypothetical protein
MVGVERVIIFAKAYNLPLNLAVLEEQGIDPKLIDLRLSLLTTSLGNLAFEKMSCFPLISDGNSLRL